MDLPTIRVEKIHLQRNEAAMSEIASLIVGSEKLTSIFGRWPSFHDAEIHDLHLQRGYINPKDQMRGDRDLEENVRRFESKPIKVRHFIYARSKRGRQ